MTVHNLHKHIITFLKSEAGTANAGQSSDSYTGSTHKFYAVPVPVRRRFLKSLIKEHKSTTDAAAWLELVDTLFAGQSHEEKTMGAYLLDYLPAVRATVSLQRINGWLGELVGWAEVDALCQNVFQPEELIQNWSAWEKFLTRLAKDSNINKRRAALVFLTGPTSKSSDAQLHSQAYKTIELLKTEKDILITKAISWLLRSMTDSQPDSVAQYVESNSDTLPKIAVRETRKKLRTGKKN